MAGAGREVDAKRESLLLLQASDFPRIRASGDDQDLRNPDRLPAAGRGPKGVRRIQLALSFPDD
jgi:hypothetical protein